MKILLFLFLLVLIPITITAYGTHQAFETKCQISISAEIIPIFYINENRGNPDGSFYPGDAFHYLFTFSGIPECLSFAANEVISEGIFDVISHNSMMWYDDTKLGHPHQDLEMQPQYLTTTHYYVDRINHCRNNPDCQSLVLAENPSYSVREDQEIPSRLSKLLDGLRTASTYSIRTEDTQDWGFTNTNGNHNHGNYSHQNESNESITSFENYIDSICSNLEKYSGCVFGHVELETEIVDEKCLLEELEKMNITHDIENDTCVDVDHSLSFSIQGTKRDCHYKDGKKVCEIVLVKKMKHPELKIFSTEFEIIFSDPPLKDRDYYDAKNLDGIYYAYDPIAIIHDPSLLWKEVRSETIQFETTKIHDLNKELEFDCNENNCNYTVFLDGLFSTEHILVNGQGMTIYNATIGDHLFHYTTIVKNLDREISRVTGSTDAQGADYFPQYESYPYPLLKDVKEYAFDDRQAVALHYFGNNRDGIIYPEERSKINNFYNIGVMYDIPYPYYINQNFTFSDGINTSNHLALESYNETAMFLQEGYGKLYFDWPINDIVSPYGFNMYNNVTSYTTLSSNNFAAKDTFLNHYELRYPETAFTKNIIIKSINQNGTIINDKIEFEIIPYKNKSEYVNVYLYNKIIYDTENKIFAEIVSSDTNPMNHTITGFGMINGTILIY